MYPGSLHCHTDYSNLSLRDSINTVESLIDYAVELGHKTIAITEHETISNAIKIEKYARKIKEKHPDFKVIRGNEIYLCRNDLTADNYKSGEFWHFILLAKDAEGHKQIRELSTRAWKRSFKTGRLVRRPTLYSDLIDIISANPGHVIGSTACLGSFIDNKILEWVEKGRPNDLKNKIIRWINNMIKIFGADNFYLEMQPSHSIEQVTVNKELKLLAEELNLKYIITCDAHYLKKEDRLIHKAYLNSQDGEREVDSFYETTYLMGTEELETFFEYFTPDELNVAYQNILDIANKCEEYTLMKNLRIPRLAWREPKPISQTKVNFYYEQIPFIKTFLNSDYEGDRILAELIINKFEENIYLQNQSYYDEINSNLEST